MKAIAAVAYLKVIDSEGKCHIGFVLGKAKQAPTTAHTVPRLELGAAVLAVELAELVKSELNISVDSLQFYTYSNVVLGYIHNQTRRFYVYVSNRVQRIRKSTEPEQWHYAWTTQNPADHATHSVFAAERGSHTTLSLQILTLRCVLMLPRCLFLQLNWDVSVLSGSYLGNLWCEP